MPGNRTDVAVTANRANVGGLRVRVKRRCARVR